MKDLIDFENPKGTVKNILMECWYSSWRFAIWKVISQWVTIILIAFIGISIVQPLFKLPSSLYDILVNNICRLVKCDPHTLTTAFSYIAFIVFVLQIYFRHKQYNSIFYFSELQYDRDISILDRSQICAEEILRCDLEKETILLEKELIKSCSPIPIVTALLGYIINLVGFPEFNWPLFVIICISVIMMYIIFCVRNIQKYKDNQWKKLTLEKTKLNLERRQAKIQ